MSKYQTEQKKLLTAFLKSHPERQFSAEQLAEIFADEGEEGATLGKSTIYRLVVQLTEDGILRRFPKQQGRGWLYQYHSESDCKGHLHLKCTKCGALVHLECGLSSELLRHIEKNHRFAVDNSASVLYGVCGKCTDEEKRENRT